MNLQEINDLAQQLEPTAMVIESEVKMQETKASWPDVERIEALRKAYKFAEAEAICRENLERYPRHQLFFNVLIDVIIKQNDLPRALQEVQKRRTWALENPYKIMTILERQGEVERDYQHTMQDWIMTLNGLNAQEQDIRSKINKGYVYKPRKK